VRFPQQSEKFTEKNYAELVNALNTLVTNNSIEDNFNGQLIENITIPSDTTVTIPHNLGRVPRHRIILRQSGPGIITDEGKWDASTIKLRNNAKVDFKLTEQERAGAAAGLVIFLDRATIATGNEILLSIVLL